MYLALMNGLLFQEARLKSTASLPRKDLRLKEKHLKLKEEKVKSQLILRSPKINQYQFFHIREFTKLLWSNLEIQSLTQKLILKPLRNQLLEAEEGLHLSTDAS